jgi:starvation-inducible DNA-binding protein
MKTEKLMQELVADLMKLNVNLHNLHWNVVGQGFMEYHNILEGMYNNVFGKYDEVAELLKAHDIYPVASFEEYTKLSKVKDLDFNRDYNEKEVLVEIKEIHEYLIAKFKEIRLVASEADEFAVANMMEDYLGEYSKTLWMIKARMK